MSIKVFLDSSVLLAAAGSKSGGSRSILNLSKNKSILLTISDLVLAEVEENLAEHFPEQEKSFKEFIAELEMDYLEVSRNDLLTGASINPKDVHVYTAFKMSKCSYLVTLDRGLLNQVNKEEGRLVSLTPGELIKKVLS